MKAASGTTGCADGTGSASWLVRSDRGDEPLCNECIRFRHRGSDFSLLVPLVDGVPCACTHMPGKLALDRQVDALRAAGVTIAEWRAGIDGGVSCR